MMREAIFNKLVHNQGIEDRTALDLFTGSGIVSLEFISRGASKVIAVDRDEKNISALKQIQNANQLENLSIQRADVFKFLKNCGELFDYIYADPPYDMPHFQQLADEAVLQLKPGGWLMVEHRPGLQLQGEIVESRKHGSSAITIFAKPNP